jgi:hypothetical protein
MIMRIEIGNVNTNNIDNLSWCLGFAGLAQMNTTLDFTTQVVLIDVNQLLTGELGEMIIALYNYGFTVNIRAGNN